MPLTDKEQEIVAKFKASHRHYFNLLERSAKIAGADIAAEAAKNMDAKPAERVYIALLALDNAAIDKRLSSDETLNRNLDKLIEPPFSMSVANAAIIGKYFNHLRSQTAHACYARQAQGISSSCFIH